MKNTKSLLETHLKLFKMSTDNLRFQGLNSQHVVESAVAQIGSGSGTDSILEDTSRSILFLEKVMNQLLIEKEGERKSLIESNKKILKKQLSQKDPKAAIFESYDYDLSAITDITSLDVYIGKRFMFDHSIYGTIPC